MFDIFALQQFAQHPGGGIDFAAGRKVLYTFGQHLRTCPPGVISFFTPQCTPTPERTSTVKKIKDKYNVFIIAPHPANALGEQRFEISNPLSTNGERSALLAFITSFAACAAMTEHQPPQSGYVRLSVLLDKPCTPGELAKACGVDLDHLGPIVINGDQALVDVTTDEAPTAREGLKKPWAPPSCNLVGKARPQMDLATPRGWS